MFFGHLFMFRFGFLPLKVYCCGNFTKGRACKQMMMMKEDDGLLYQLKQNYFCFEVVQDQPHITYTNTQDKHTRTIIIDLYVAEAFEMS